MHHQLSVFFSLQEAGLLRLEFLPNALLRLGGPRGHGGISQTPDFFNQQILDLIGGLERTFRAPGDFQNALKPFHHQRLLAQLLEEMDFFLAQFAGSSFFLFHPNCI